MGFLVAQMGARMQYAVPRILAERGLLCCLFTDLLANRWPLSWCRVLPERLSPGFVSKLPRRVPQGIDRTLARAFPLFGFRYAVRLRRARCPAEATAVHLWAGRTFTSLVNVHARWSHVDSVYGFNSAALELLVEAKRRGKRAVLEQTSLPRRIENDLLSLEGLKWPDWACRSGVDTRQQEFSEREEAEWEASDVIVCGSDSVKENIRRCVPDLADECAVVPYGVDGECKGNGTSQMAKSGRSRLNVFVAGALCLWKGTPYVIQAARQLTRLADFKLAGAVTVDASALKDIPPNLEILGHVSKEEMRRLYSWADVFLLPSICEGSARVTYEALSMGVPVICTPNTGSVVRDGIEGCIIPTGSSEAIGERIITLHDDPGLLAQMSCRAFERAQEFSVAAYGERLLKALS